mmetsp:Transcript_9088/g.9965  ORF Transcript_9088/g.9965 Transcript_9088/m.9965 type:complete len:91 (-) Transcript_9088:90-362(-)
MGDENCAHHSCLGTPMSENFQQCKPKSVQTDKGTKRGREPKGNTGSPCKKLALDLGRMVAFSLTGYVVAGGPTGASVGFATACAHSLKGR